MKKITLFVCTAIIVLSSCKAQKSSVKARQFPLAKVQNWTDNIFILPDNYWNNGNDKKAQEIISQIGSDEFEKVKVYSNSTNIPCQFLIFCETRDGSPKKNIDSLREKLNRLTAYKIATYTHINNTGNSSKWAIVSVPYDKNKNWDLTAKWDTVYFILPAKDVEEIRD